ncbi:MAG: sulfurtransferase [Gammaproteobacteria bacterium]
MSYRTLIGTDNLRALLGTPRLAVIDCRFYLMKPDAGRQDYLESHIPGARYADLNRDLSAPIGADTGRHPLPNPEDLARRLTQLGISSDSQVVAYDYANGSFAARLWWLLRWLGHDAVAVLDGGLQAWIQDGGPLQSGEPPVSAAPGTPSARPVAPRGDGVALDGVANDGVANDGVAAGVVTSAELERALFATAAGARKPLLVDARAPERFAGAVEPIDPVAGHIPGAVNYPFSANLDVDNRFLPAAELKRRWLERLAGTAPENLIAMCGSGVTACHNLLSLEIAGLAGAKLYAGSWSEWIRDARRPVARG